MINEPNSTLNLRRLIAAATVAGLMFTLVSSAEAAIPPASLNLDGKVGVTTDGTGNVTNWADQSGNGNDVSDIAASRDDTQLPAQLAGGWIGFDDGTDGNKDWLAANSATDAGSASNLPALGSDWHMFAVVRPTGPQSVSWGQAAVWGNEATTTGNGVLGATFATSAPPSEAFFHPIGGGGNVQLRTGGTLTNNTAYIFELSNTITGGTTGNTTLTLDGSSTATLPYNYTANAADSFQVSGNPENVNNTAWVGDVAQIMFFDSVLSETDRQDVGGFLADKWGVPGSQYTGMPGPDDISIFWGGDTSGDWNDDDARNWNGVGAPPGANQSAVFGDLITTLQTVFTNTGVTVNDVQFVNAATYIVSGGGTIHLASGTSPLLPTSGVTVALGSHQFQAAVQINNDATVDIASGATLIFNNALNLMGNTLTKTGAGEMAINNVLSTGGGEVQLLEGTITGNGTVGGDVNNEGGTISPGNAGVSSSVPEPTGLILATFGFLGVLLRTRVVASLIRSR